MTVNVSVTWDSDMCLLVLCENYVNVNININNNSGTAGRGLEVHQREHLAA